MGCWQVAGDEVRVCFSGRSKRQCDLFSGDIRQRLLEVKDGGVGRAIQRTGIQVVLELVPHLGRQCRELAARRNGRIRQRAHQDAVVLRNDGLAAEDVTYGGIGFLGVDVILHLCLVSGECSLYGGTVDVLYPACGVDGGTGLGLGDEGLGIQRDLAFDVHALGIGVLLVAGIQRHPGVGLFVDGAATGDVVHECFDPDVFEFDEFDLSAGCHADVGDAALAHELLGGFGFGDAAYPVHGTVGRDLDGAVDVAGGDVCCAQEADEEAGGIEAVTHLGLQGHVRTLDGAVGGEGFDGVSDPVVDLHRVVV